MRVPSAGHEHFEVEADVGVHAWGPDLETAFAEATLGVFALIVDPAEVEARETREVRAQSGSPEGLLAAWIDECLYVHEIEGFVVSRVKLDRADGAVAHGVLHGEEFDAARHRPGTVVKAATLHGLSVTIEAGHADVRVVVDL